MISATTFTIAAAPGRKLEQQALGTGGRIQRNALLGRAIRLKQDTGALMLN